MTRLGIMAAGLMLLACVGSTQAEQNVTAFVEELSAELESALQRSDLEALNAVLVRAVDYSSIARGVVGPYRSQVSAEQQQTFSAVFQTSFELLLSQALVGDGRYEIEVFDAKLHGSNKAQVPVKVATGGGSQFDLLFSLAVSDDSWRVRNVIVNGVNLGLTYRNQFHELMKSHDFDVELVIANWRVDPNVASGSQVGGR